MDLLSFLQSYKYNGKRLDNNVHYFHYFMPAKWRPLLLSGVKRWRCIGCTLKLQSSREEGNMERIAVRLTRSKLGPCQPSACKDAPAGGASALKEPRHPLWHLSPHPTRKIPHMCNVSFEPETRTTSSFFNSCAFKESITSAAFKSTLNLWLRP